MADTSSVGSEFAGKTAGESTPVDQSIAAEDTGYTQGKAKLDQGNPPDTTACPDAALKNPILSNNALSGEDYDGNFSPYINKHKIVHVRVGAGDYLNQMNAEQIDNWRKKSVNSLCDVDPHVVLISPSLDFSFSQTVSYGKAMDPEEMTKQYAGNTGAGLLKKGSDMIDNAVQLAAASGMATDKIMAAAGATYKSEYSGVKTFEGCEVTLPSAIKFEFSFGKYGLFDGRKEVVEPILALASIFSMQPMSMPGLYKGPVPTASWMKVQVMKEMKDIIKGSLDVGKMVDSAKASIENLKEEVAEVMSEGDMMARATKAATKALETAVNVKSKAYAAFNAVSQMALNQPGTRLLTFSVGKQIVGPLYVENVTWNFDFSSVDQFGYPCYGTIEYGKLSSPHIGSFRTVNTFRIQG